MPHYFARVELHHEKEAEAYLQLHKKMLKYKFHRDLDEKVLPDGCYIIFFDTIYSIKAVLKLITGTVLAELGFKASVVVIKFATSDDLVVSQLEDAVPEV
jgi:hypothetical protein